MASVPPAIMNPGQSSTGSSKQGRDRSPSVEILDRSQVQRKPSVTGSKQQPSQQAPKIQGSTASVSASTTSHQALRRRCSRCQILLPETNWQKMCKDCRVKTNQYNNQYNQAKRKLKETHMAETLKVFFAQPHPPKLSGVKPNAGSSTSLKTVNGSGSGVGVGTSSSTKVSTSKSHVRESPSAVVASPLFTWVTDGPGKAKSFATTATSTSKDPTSKPYKPLDFWRKEGEKSMKTPQLVHSKRPVISASTGGDAITSDDDLADSVQPLRKKPKISTSTAEGVAVRKPKIGDKIKSSIGGTGPRMAKIDRKGKGRAEGSVDPMSEDDVPSPVDAAGPRYIELLGHQSSKPTPSVPPAIKPKKPITIPNLSAPVKPSRPELSSPSSAVAADDDEAFEHQTLQHLLYAVSVARKAHKNKLNWYGTYSVIAASESDNMKMVKEVSRELKKAGKLMFDMHTNSAQRLFGLSNRGEGRSYKCTCLDRSAARHHQHQAEAEAGAGAEQDTPGPSNDDQTEDAERPGEGKEPQSAAAANAGGEAKSRFYNVASVGGVGGAGAEGGGVGEALSGCRGGGVVGLEDGVWVVSLTALSVFILDIRSIQYDDTG
ncbi:hypothetical protein AX16_001660 [Volvariella volvacea WC 439]|nr:hypothetical protein AX16_001660 [Volvariella volvacea WC 439]